MVLLVFVSALLMTLDHRQQLLEPVRQGLAAAVYPIRLAANLPSEVGDFVNRQLESRRDLRETNARLRSQVLLYQARLQKLDALEVENIRLRQLLDSSYEVGESVVIAEQLRVDLDPYTHLIQIDKGATEGVFLGQPVLDANGVIGQVDRIGPLSATVRLVTDPSHAIPVQVNRNGVRTVAMGTGNLRRLELTSLPNNTDIVAGDLLVTSGLGGRFPSGYPVARVTSVKVDPGREFAQVTAVPTGALDRTQEVLLIRRASDGLRLAQPAEGSGSSPAEEGWEPGS